MNFLKEIFYALMDILFPSRCGSCNKEFVYDGEIFCKPCKSSIEEVPYPVYDPAEGISALFSPFAYGGAIAEAIIRCKHGRDPALALKLARLALKITPPPQCEIVLPVPLHRKRLAFRGFNQSTYLAREAAKISSAPWSPSILLRHKETIPQKGLSKSERYNNLKGSFMVPAKKIEKIKEKRVLLVDDVWTTGATMHSCAEALLKAGVKEVYAFTICRVV